MASTVDECNSHDPRAPPMAHTSKAFVCDFEHCTKTYSRAEHLARHQLNHRPKKTYHCDIAGCARSFVRADLFVRHTKRHYQSTPSLQQTDETVHTSDIRNTGTRRHVGRPRLSSLAARSRSPSTKIGYPSHTHQQAEADFQENMSNNLHSKSHHLITGRSRAVMEDVAQSQPYITEWPSQTAPLSIEPVQGTDPGFVAFHSSTSDQLQQPVMEMPPLDGRSVQPDHTYGSSGLTGGHSSANLGFPDISESSMDEFANWCIGDFQNLYSGMPPFGSQYQFGAPDLSHQLYPTDDSTSWERLSNAQSIEMSGSAHDFSKAGDGDLSKSAWRSLIVFMQTHFGREVKSKFHVSTGDLLAGDMDVDDHPLSLQNMNTYIASYWHTFHDQLPILHKHTFIPQKLPQLLLLAIMAVGAAHLPQTVGEQRINEARQFADSTAWHLRLHIFMHDDFHPPAKLWILQALILLDVYEKMSTTRFLHERANLHHPTIITSIRRAAANVEFDSEHDITEKGMSSQEWWRYWLKREATKRAALAAFMLDTSHAFMFGHSAVMVVHEIQLPLPCDDALWEASSPEEVARIEASLSANCIRPMTLLQALKRTLTSQSIRTNSFGRMVVFAGIMSLCWHMRQRDSHVDLLEASSGLRVPATWRETLTQTMDFWKCEFDKDHGRRARVFLAWKGAASVATEGSLSLESASVAHHLGHLALQIDIVDAQIMAGTPKVLGRTITDVDQEKMTRRLAKWAGSPGGALSFHHALQLLRECFDPFDDVQLQSYTASDDPLKSRSWMLYYAALTVWCYTYFKKDPVEWPTTTSSFCSSSFRPRESARTSVECEDGLVSRDSMLTEPSNRDGVVCGMSESGMPISSQDRVWILTSDRLVAMFKALAAGFRESNWELLHEAADRLEDLCGKTAGQDG